MEGEDLGFRMQGLGFYRLHRDYVMVWDVGCRV